MADTATCQVDVGAVYDEHFRLIVGTAIARYRICESDAETLAHDVFLSFILKAEEVRDARAWLVSAICNASKYYLRVRSRTVELTADVVDTREARDTCDVTGQMMARECLACLTPRCQLALRLRYIEGYSAAEIAEELRTTPKYAQKLLGRCLRQAQDRYNGSST